jgi:hypothetical protein
MMLSRNVYHETCLQHRGYGCFHDRRVSIFVPITRYTLSSSSSSKQKLTLLMKQQHLSSCVKLFKTHRCTMDFDSSFCKVLFHGGRGEIVIIIIIIINDIIIFISFVVAIIIFGGVISKIMRGCSDAPPVTI